MNPQHALALAAQRRLELASAAASARTGRRREPPPAAAGRGGAWVDGPEAFGVRAYLTPREARKLARDFSELVSRYEARLEDPALRPAGAQPFEVVVLGGRIGELVGADRPGSGSSRGGRHA